MHRFKPMLNRIILIFVIMISSLFAQKEIITQPIVPHPIMELHVWQVHTGNLDVDEVFNASSNSVWQTETINHVWWEKNLVKWYKKEIVIPEEFNGRDILMEFRVDPVGVIFVNGKKLFQASQYNGNAILVTRNIF